MCGISLSILSENTGIPEVELLSYAEGTHALNARDRFAILSELVEWCPGVRHRVDAVTQQRNEAAYRQLMSEVIEEDQAEPLNQD